MGQTTFTSDDGGGDGDLFAMNTKVGQVNPDEWGSGALCHGWVWAFNQTGHEIDTVGHDQAAEIGDDGDEGLLKRHGWTITADGQTTNGTSGSRPSESSPAEHTGRARVSGSTGFGRAPQAAWKRWTGSPTPEIYAAARAPLRPFKGTWRLPPGIYPCSRWLVAPRTIAARSAGVGSASRTSSGNAR